MDNKTDHYITILSFAYLHEATIVRGRLESEGIVCDIKDGLSAQVSPLYSKSIGGVKLRVLESDFQRAVELLKETGDINENSYIKQNYLQRQLFKFIFHADKTTSKLPLLKKMKFGLRLIVIATVAFGLIGSFIYFATLPTTIERLTKNNWYVNQVYFKDKNFIPETETESMIKISGGGYCVEGITFGKDGTVKMPGFKSRAAIGEWGIYNDSLQISKIDTFNFVYNGSYAISFSRFGLVLKSATTTLDCQAENIRNNIHIPYN